MTFPTRASLAWPAMTLAGLVLSAYVYAAWPETAVPKSPTAEPRSQPVRTTASVDSYPESELTGVAGAVHPGYLYVYEVSPTPLLDALIQAPLPVDAR